MDGPVNSEKRTDAEVQAVGFMTFSIFVVVRDNKVKWRQSAVSKEKLIFREGN